MIVLRDNKPTRAEKDCIMIIIGASISVLFTALIVIGFMCAFALVALISMMNSRKVTRKITTYRVVNGKRLVSSVRIIRL